MSEIATRNPQADLMARVRDDAFKKEIALALPPSISVDRFVRVTVTALMQTPELAEADRHTFLHSLIKCAQDGLLPDGREAALVIFGGKVQYLPMVGGIRQKVAEFGWTIRARVVFEHDEFHYEYGLDQTLIHRPPPPGTDRGNMVAAYAVASHRDGRKEFVVMTADQIEKVKAVAKTKSVWNQWPEQMWEKSAAKQLAADLPLDPAERDQVRTLIAADDFQPGEAAAMLYGPDNTEMRAIEAPPESAAPVADGDATGGGESTSGPENAASPDPAAVASAVDDETRMLADEAGTTIPPSGTWSATGPKGGMTLAQMEKDTAGRKYLGMLLKRLEATIENQDYYDAVWTFCRVYCPDLVAAAAGREDRS